MRRLRLLRHAKAETSNPGRRDHDRILAKRGRSDAARLGSYLARHSFVPDHALVSGAARTRETWTLLAEALGQDLGQDLGQEPTADIDESLYDASPRTIRQAIQETEPGVGTLLVIGHNPGLQELATMLTASGDVDTRRRLQESFPTTALAVIHFATEDWGGVHAKGGRLEHFITPQWLEAATD
jgi:phosphohistidine phosphatase